jgi:hypothetical protein
MASRRATGYNGRVVEYNEAISDLGKRPPERKPKSLWGLL